MIDDLAQQLRDELDFAEASARASYQRLREQQQQVFALTAEVERLRNGLKRVCDVGDRAAVLTAEEVLRG